MSTRWVLARSPDSVKPVTAIGFAKHHLLCLRSLIPSCVLRVINSSATVAIFSGRMKINHAPQEYKTRRVYAQGT